jgi:hypothetical protein
MKANESFCKDNSTPQNYPIDIDQKQKHASPYYPVKISQNDTAPQDNSIQLKSDAKLSTIYTNLINLSKFLSDFEVFLLFIILFISGFGYGVIESFLLLRVIEIQGSGIVIGMTILFL